MSFGNKRGRVTNITVSRNEGITGGTSKKMFMENYLDKNKL